MAQVPDEPPVVRTLEELREAENACRRCPLYRDATQAVPGEGPRHPPVMLVGEQPGHKERPRRQGVRRAGWQAARPGARRMLAFRVTRPS